MHLKTGEKFCTVLLGMGGPETINDVPKYLYNIFSDRNIIRFPGGALMQKPMARLISRLRSEKVKAHYSQIGDGSPLLHWTDTQKQHIENIIAPIHPGFRCYVGMSYFRPFITEAIKSVYRDGFRKIIFLPLYPQYCRATTGSAFLTAEKELSRYRDIKAEFIKDFHDNKDYIELLKDYIGKSINENDILLFSAHSIPQKFVDEGDPYVEQVKKTVELAASEREYHLSFQSRTGPVKWVGPDTISEAIRLTKTSDRNLFVVPISFICDHIETLHEIDIELKGLVKENTGNVVERMPMFNDDHRLGTALAKLIIERVTGTDA